MSRMNPTPERYLVEFWDDEAPVVSYSATFGPEALQWAKLTAYNYGGKVYVELSNGRVEDLAGRAA